MPETLGPPLPELSDREGLALLCRVLVREGYDDHLAGHVTALQGDGSLLVNPFGIPWDEVCASDVIRIDAEGRVLESAKGYGPNPGVRLHLALHEARHDVRWAVHNHPRWGSVWAGAQRSPPAYDQSSAFCGEVLLVDEYEGAVNDAGAAAKLIERIGDGNVVILANHGVFLLGSELPVVLMRALALERRCRSAWHVEALGGGVEVAPEIQRMFSEGLSRGGFPGLWEALVRRELRNDPGVLDVR